MKKMTNKKGFTLAELLIVVAIIAVLVAISIPVFTTQLEKAREATDAANIRSAYAEVMSEALTNADNDVSQTVELKQTQDGWQGDIDDIGGIDVSALDVGKGVTVTVAYDADATTQVTITAGAAAANNGGGEGN